MIHVIWRLASRLSTRSLPSGRSHIPRETRPHLEEEGNIPRSVRDSLSRAHARHSSNDSISQPVDRLLIFIHSFPLSSFFFFLLFFPFFFPSSFHSNRWNLIWHRVERRFDKLNGQSWSSANRFWLREERIISTGWSVIGYQLFISLDWYKHVYADSYFSRF